MDRITVTRAVLTAALSLSILFPIEASAVTLFEEDFEIDGKTPSTFMETRTIDHSGAVITPVPTTPMSFVPPFDPSANPTALHTMSIIDATGSISNDMYRRSQAIKHSGQSSMEHRFDGRNNYCNSCLYNRQGFTVDNLPSGDKSLETNTASILDEFIIQDGITLPESQEVYLWNKSDSYARWRVKSRVGNALTFYDDAPDLNEMGGAGNFNIGDQIEISPHCPNGERRNDCNLMINYLNGLDPANHFPLGGTLARRFYIFIPSATTLPDITLKFAYIRRIRNGVAYADELNLATQRMTMHINHNILDGTLHETGIPILKDTWYYFEEVWKRESASNVADGEYDLYFHPITNPTDIPVYSKNGLIYGDVQLISIMGNRQSFKDAEGSVYIDDVKIATGGRIGPIPEDDIVPLPPIELN